MRSDLGFMSSRLVKMFLSIVGTIWAYFWPRIQEKQGGKSNFFPWAGVENPGACGFGPD